VKYVIIGNSAAGISAVEAIRSVDKESEVTVLSKDSQCAYSPALTTYLMSGKIEEKFIYFREPKFYTDNKIDLKLGEAAKSIDPQKKTVTLDKGKKISYDKLLIAVGSKPVVPPVKGINQKGVFTLRCLDDAKNISKYVSKKKKVLIIGGGLVGLRAAYAMEQLGLAVTVVELAPQIMPQNMDKTAAGIVSGFLAENGWEIITGKYVAELKGGKNGVESAVLSDGSELPAPAVIVGTGVRPDVELAKTAGIETNLGIIVNDKMEVKIKGVKKPDIYAAGDVAEAYDYQLDKKAVNAIWPLARKQGKVAGLNMAGEKEKYEGGIPMNSVDFYGLTAMSVGRSDLPGTKFSIKKSDYEYRKIGIKDNRLVHFTLVGNVERAGLLTGLIEDRVDVSSFKKDLMNENFGFLSMPENMRKMRILEH
jgi:NAD(P)H-nitrite reductase large subunit